MNCTEVNYPEGRNCTEGQGKYQGVLGRYFFGWLRRLRILVLVALQTQTSARSGQAFLQILPGLLGNPSCIYQNAQIARSLPNKITTKTIACRLLMHGRGSPTWALPWCRAEGEPLLCGPPRGHAEGAQRKGSHFVMHTFDDIRLWLLTT